MGLGMRNTGHIIVGQKGPVGPKRAFGSLGLGTIGIQGRSWGSYTGSGRVKNNLDRIRGRDEV